MGYNPFNPAMAGYALVLVSFPVQLTTTWALPAPLLEQGHDISTVLQAIWHGQIADGFTGATPLDLYKHQIGHGTFEEVIAHPIFGGWAGIGWSIVNLGFLFGGVILIALRVMPWQTPVAVLLGISVPSLLLGWDADRYTPLNLHLLSGATMLGAFFIATDPVTSSTTRLGRWVFGIGIGLLTYIIRTWGAYPDAIAFAVLLMNFAAPLIDIYTQPRTYGYADAKRGPKSREH
jgi:electron transport complex protein RnfD